MQKIIIICGGIHSIKITKKFVDLIKIQLKDNLRESYLIIPLNQRPPYDAKNLFDNLMENGVLPQEKALTIIAFSAGVVGCLAMARKWQREGGIINCLIAFDGWGVPLIGDFPIHCFSHDLFTHLTTCFWVNNNEHFYAQPAVSHLEMWTAPLTVSGYHGEKRMNLTESLNLLLNKYHGTITTNFNDN